MAQRITKYTITIYTLKKQVCIIEQGILLTCLFMCLCVNIYAKCVQLKELTFQTSSGHFQVHSHNAIGLHLWT